MRLSALSYIHRAYYTLYIDSHVSYTIHEVVRTLIHTYIGHTTHYILTLMFLTQYMRLSALSYIHRAYYTLYIDSHVSYTIHEVVRTLIHTYIGPTTHYILTLMFLTQYMRLSALSYIHRAYYTLYIDSHVSYTIHEVVRTLIHT